MKNPPEFSRSLAWAKRRENFWRWLDIFPGNVVLLAVILIPPIVFWLLAAVNFCLLLAGGDPAGILGRLPAYLLLGFALFLFPGESPLWQKIVALGLVGWAGGTPAVWGYITLAACSRRQSPVVRGLWRIISWLPEKGVDLLRRLRRRQAPSLAPAKPLTWTLVILILLLGCAGLRFRFNLRTIDANGWAPADAAEYEMMARQITEGRPLGLNHSAIFPVRPPLPTYANRTPGYPAFLALVYRLTSPPRARQWRTLARLQALLDVAAGLLLFFALRRILPNWAALGGLLLWVAYVPAVMASGMLLAESFAAFLLCLLLFSTLAIKSLWGWAGAGLLAAAIALTRPELSGLIVLLALALWVGPELSRRRRLLGLGLLLLCFVAAMSPWWVRNYSIFGKFVPSSTVGGFNFWAGNYLPFQGVVRPASYDLAAELARREKIDPSDELALDKVLWREGFKNVGRYLISQPGAYGRLLLRKFQETWGLPWEFDLGPFTPLNLRSPLMFFFFLGIGVALLHWRKLLPLLGLPVYQTLAHVASYGHESRYLLPVLPMVFGLAMAGLWFSSLPASRKRPEAGEA